MAPRATSACRYAWLVPGLLVLAAIPAPPAAHAETTARSDQVEVALVSEEDAVVPGKPLSLAVAFKVREGWHIYWRNPGDAGVATAIRWSVPAGYAASDVRWPAPRRFVEHGAASYGYAGETWLLSRVQAPPNATTGGTVRVVADVEWLACEAICVPGEAKLSLSLPVAAERRTIAAERFERARTALPTAARWPTRFAVTPERLTLEIARPPTPGARLRAVEFFPDSGEVLDHAAPQHLTQGTNGFTLAAARGPIAKAPDSLSGVLAIEEDGPNGRTRRAYEIRARGPGGE